MVDDAEWDDFTSAHGPFDASTPLRDIPSVAQLKRQARRAAKRQSRREQTFGEALLKGAFRLAATSRVWVITTVAATIGLAIQGADAASIAPTIGPSPSPETGVMSTDQGASASADHLLQVEDGQRAQLSQPGRMVWSMSKTTEVGDVQLTVWKDGSTFTVQALGPGSSFIQPRVEPRSVDPDRVDSIAFTPDPQEFDGPNNAGFLYIAVQPRAGESEEVDLSGMFLQHPDGSYPESPVEIDLPTIHLSGAGVASFELDGWSSDRGARYSQSRSVDQSDGLDVGP